jgi:Na+-driven multidrug efflux pump
MQYIGGTIGIIFGVLLIIYRERVGDFFGQPDWATKVGGIYNVVIFVGVFMFFWSLAAMTNTTDLLFAPFFAIFPRKVDPTGF